MRHDAECAAAEDERADGVDVAADPHRVLPARGALACELAGGGSGRAPAAVDPAASSSEAEAAPPGAG